MSEDNLELRFKDVVTKIKTEMEKDYDAKLSKEKEDVINNLLNMFPHLESKKNEIMQECIGKKDLFENHINEPTNNPTNDPLTISSDDVIVPITVTAKKHKQQHVAEEMLFDEIEYNGKKFYLNDNKGIWDGKAKLVGSLLGYDSNGDPIISFFDTVVQQDIPEKLKKILKTI